MALAHRIGLPFPLGASGTRAELGILLHSSPPRNPENPIASALLLGFKPPEPLWPLAPNYTPRRDTRCVTATLIGQGGRVWLLAPLQLWEDDGGDVWEKEESYNYMQRFRPRDQRPSVTAVKNVVVQIGTAVASLVFGHGTIVASSTYYFDPILSMSH